MRVLLDGSRLTIGGGLQVGVSLVTGMAGAVHPGWEWHVVASPMLAAQIPDSARRQFAAFHVLRRRLGALSQVTEAAVALPQIERLTRPSVVFTIFGPTLYRPRAPHLVGFALPRLIYKGRSSGIAYRGLSDLKRQLVDAWARRRVSRQCYWVVEAKSVRDRMATVLGVPEERIYVIPNTRSPWVSEAQASTAVRGHAARPLFRILVPAADYPHKNLDVIPRVAGSLRALGAQPYTFVFTLPKEGAGWRRLKSSFSHLGLGAAAETVGAVAVDAMGAVYASCDAVFLPTLLECATAVYPEAFAAGRPLITSKRDFAVEQCDDAALYVEPLDADACAETLLAVMQGRALREDLVRRGRQHLVTYFPSPAQKLELQMSVIQDVVRRGNG